MAEKKVKSNDTDSFEQKLWKTADKLRKNIDAAEYKHIVLGLIFLKYISDAFEELHHKLIAGEGDYAGADPEDRDEYAAENVFFVPVEARWSYLQGQAKQPDIVKRLIWRWRRSSGKMPSDLRGFCPRSMVSKS
jgi:type I restriction enzyme M protein